MFMGPSDEISRMSSVVVFTPRSGVPAGAAPVPSLLRVSRALDGKNEERLCDKLLLPHLHSPDTLGSGFCLLGILGNIT